METTKSQFVPYWQIKDNSNIVAQSYAAATTAV